MFDMKITPLEQYRGNYCENNFHDPQMRRVSHCSLGWFNLTGYTMTPKNILDT